MITSKFNKEITQLFSKQNTNKIAIAVSGGSDSLALCVLLHSWCKSSNVSLVALTVDHGLRKESFAEALKVQFILKKLNIDHEILQWLGDKPVGNLQEAARIARYNLLTNYCKSNKINCLATGHQQNDQAENFIIRAEHGAGIYGLAGIPRISEYNNIKIIRPLLDFSKKELQTFLNEQNIEWIEDPSNENERFARVRARKFLNQYPQWIPKLAALTRNLARTKECIESIVEKTIEEIVKFDNESATIDIQKFNKLEQEIRFRTIAKILQIISEKEKIARAERIERLLAKIETESSFKAATLSGCLIIRKKLQLIIYKERIDNTVMK